MKDFFAMGGYGLYVWWSYGITAFIFVLFFITSGKALQNAKAKVRRYLRRTGQVN